MKRTPRKGVRSFHQPFGIVPMQAKEIFVGKALDVLEAGLHAQCIDELNQRVLALATHNIVYVLRIQCGIGIDGRKVAAPDNRDARMKPPNFTRGFHCSYHLWAWHDRDAQELDIALVDKTKNISDGVAVDVAIYDLVLFTAFQHGCQSQNRNGEAAVTWLGGRRVKKDNHLRTAAR